MVYVIIGICVVVVVAIGITVCIKVKAEKEVGDNELSSKSENSMEFMAGENTSQELIIQMEMLLADSISDSSKLVEITDSKVLAQINNLVPGFVQVGNSVNNAAQALQENGEVLYRAILPAGAKLADSRAMENAVRGIYHGADGISGHANFMAVEAQNGTAVVANTTAAAMGVASMVVGQYYMKQIDAELGVIKEGVSKISGFLNDEYRSRVFSNIVHVKKIADFQSEILENQELRFSKIGQLDNLEEECTQLLGQANLSLANHAEQKSLDYKTYEKEVKELQDWYIYQKSLMEVLYQIADLRYTLHLGVVSREQCNAILPTYIKQVSDTQERLSAWHQENMKNFNMDIEEMKRKRAGIDGAIHFIPGLMRDERNYRAIDSNIAKMINAQASEQEMMCTRNMSNLYAEDVQLIAKNGKVYYFLTEGMKGE